MVRLLSKSGTSSGEVIAVARTGCTGMRRDSLLVGMSGLAAALLGIEA